MFAVASAMTTFLIVAFLVSKIQKSISFGEAPICLTPITCLGLEHQKSPETTKASGLGGKGGKDLKTEYFLNPICDTCVPILAQCL